MAEAEREAIGFEALQKLFGALPAELPAAVFITLHVHERSEGILPAFLNRAELLPATQVVDCAEIRGWANLCGSP
jgi:chemotaxis response regulator CheB